MNGSKLVRNGYTEGLEHYVAISERTIVDAARPFLDIHLKIAFAICELPNTHLAA